MTPKQLAAALQSLWHQVMRGREGQMYELFHELGLSMTDVKTLHALDNAGEALSVGELSERLGASLPAASRTVEALLQRGWVARREDERDRRMKRVTLTAGGRDIVRRLTDARMHGLEDFAASLAPAQRARLHEALSGLAKD